MNVLVADDPDLDRATAAGLLEKHGHSVVIA